MSGADAGARYSLAGLIALYRFEPSLRDVIVEGRVDAALVRWYLLERGLDVSAFPVDERVDVPQELVEELRLDTNVRGRAIAVAIQVERELGKGQSALTIIVDADYWHVIGPQHHESSCLLVTDSASMEGYALQARPFEKFLRLGLHMSEDVDIHELVTSLRLILLDLFAARAVLFMLGVAVISDPYALCTVSGDESGADIGEIIARSMGRIPVNERTATVAEAVDDANVIRSWGLDRDDVCRGHDIAPLLIRFLPIRGAMARLESVEASLRTCLEARDLDDAPLFRALVERVAS